MLKGENPEIQLKNKLATQYAVKPFIEGETKGGEMFASVSDVDMTKREVKFVWNTPLFLDSDLDVIMPGAGKKSIKERGPESKAFAKIKNLKDHNMNIVPGKLVWMGEEEINIRGQKILVSAAVSKMLTTTAGNDQLISYQEGAIDNHSFGFLYGKVKAVERKSGDDWKRTVNMCLNPKAFDDTDHCFVVSEYQMFENSSVAFGANSLTPYLGVKSGNKEALKLKVIDRLSILEKVLRRGEQSDEAMQNFEIQIRQLKQLIEELSPFFDVEDQRQKAIEIEPEVKTGLDYGKLLNALK